MLLLRRAPPLEEGAADDAALAAGAAPEPMASCLRRPADRPDDLAALDVSRAGSVDLLDLFLGRGRGCSARGRGVRVVALTAGLTVGGPVGAADGSGANSSSNSKSDVRAMSASRARD